MLSANTRDAAPAPLLSLFPSLRTGQILHLFLIDFDLSRFFHLGSQAGNKEAERFLLFILYQGVPDLVLPGIKFLRGRLLAVQNRQDDTGIAVVDRTTNLARLHAEGYGSGAGHGTYVRDLTIGLHKVAGFDCGTGFFRGLFQIVLGLGPIRQLLPFLGKQRSDAFIFEFALYAAANLVEGWSRWRLDRQYLEYCVSLRQLYLVGRSLFSLAEYRAHELGRISDAGQVIGSADEICINDLKSFCRRCLFESSSAGLAE